ncbi:MAG: hypothetical protein ACJAYC_001829 [Halieaceae bacterium]|jgi:hypothetical protein
MEENSSQKALDSISSSRRDFVNKSVKAGFVLPVVASFTMSGLMATPASAQPNMS